MEPIRIRELNDKQIAAILHCIRWWQESTEDIDGELSHAELDDLCEYLNCGGSISETD